MNGAGAPAPFAFSPLAGAGLVTVGNLTYARELMAGAREAIVSGALRGVRRRGRGRCGSQRGYAGRFRHATPVRSIEWNRSRIWEQIHRSGRHVSPSCR